MTLLRYFAKAKVVDPEGDRNQGETYCRGQQTCGRSTRTAAAKSIQSYAYGYSALGGILCMIVSVINTQLCGHPILIMQICIN